MFDNSKRNYNYTIMTLRTKCRFAGEEGTIKVSYRHFPSAMACVFGLLVFGRSFRQVQVSSVNRPRSCRCCKTIFNGSQPL